MVIGGQHSTAAIRQLRDELLAAHRPVPRWAAVVSALVVRHQAPVSARQLLAGRQQFQQAQVTALPLSDTVALLLTPDVRAKADPTDRLITALLKAGNGDVMKRLVCPGVRSPPHCKANDAR